MWIPSEVYQVSPMRLNVAIKRGVYELGVESKKG